MDNNEYLNVIDVIQKEVDALSAEMFSGDTTCPPKFIVSADIDSDRILLTVIHGDCHTVSIFPKCYGDLPIKPLMETLYNSTM